MRITVKQIVRKLTENLGPRWLPFGGGGSFRLAPALNSKVKKVGVIQENDRKPACGVKVR